LHDGRDAALLAGRFMTVRAAGPRVSVASASPPVLNDHSVVNFRNGRREQNESVGPLALIDLTEALAGSEDAPQKVDYSQSSRVARPRAACYHRITRVAGERAGDCTRRRLSMAELNRLAD